MKQRFLVLVPAGMPAPSLAVGTAAATGAGQPSENASCMGNERAIENSAGGEREKGEFGQDQSNVIHFLHALGLNYGQSIASPTAHR